MTFEQGHQSRHRAGAGPEQGAAGDAAAAPRGAAAGPDRHQVAAGLPDDRGRPSTRPIPPRSDVADYLVSNLQDPIGRVTRRRRRAGVRRRSMRCASGSIPRRLPATADAQRHRAAIEAQNTQVSAGKIGGLPAAPGQKLERDRDRAVAAANAGAVPRTSSSRPDRTARQVRLGDVARVELGSESYNFAAARTAIRRSGMAVQLAPGADALTHLGSWCKARGGAPGEVVPAGFRVRLPADSTEFVGSRSRKWSRRWSRPSCSSSS